MKIIIYLLVIIVFSGCSETISSEIILANSKIKARIAITDDPKTKELDAISVFLYDKDDKTIATNNIGITINNKDLYLSGGNQQRYYHTKSKYQYYTDSIPVSNHYFINMVLADSTNFELASFKPINPNNVKLSFTTDAKSDDYQLKWNVLEDIKEMKYMVRRSQQYLQTKTYSRFRLTKKHTK